MLPHMTHIKNIDRMIKSLRTEDSEVVTRIRQKIKQKSIIAFKERMKYSNIKSLTKVKKVRSSNRSLVNKLEGKLDPNKKKQGLPFFIYNNEKQQKTVAKTEIKDASDFLKIERASIYKKQQTSTNKSLSSHRSSLKALNQSQRISKNDSNEERLIKTSKLSVFYLNHSQKSQNDESKKYIHRESGKQNLRKSNLMPRSELVFIQSLKRYLRIIEEMCLGNSIQYRGTDNYSNDIPTYKIEENSNFNFVEDALKRRWWWKQYKHNAKSKQRPAFIWTQLKNEQYFAKENIKQTFTYLKIDTIQSCMPEEQLKSHREMHNHLKNSKYITSKIALFQILNKARNPNIKIPKKYYIHHKTSRFWLKFQNDNYSQDKKRGKNILLNYLRENNKFWIIKNAESQNKNHFLKILKSHEAIQEFLNENLSIKQTLIIQEYIQHPFLYKDRKFNVKAYALITKFQDKVKLYWYNMGLMEICSQIYDKQSKSPYVHFANEAIQITHPKFGQSQPANKISFDQFEDYLGQIESARSFHRDVLPVMKSSAQFIIQKTYNKLIEQRTSYELFQFNYVIDCNFVPWMVSVHTNPCLQGTCPLLQTIFPRLVDDTLKLTIDLYYPPPKTWPKNKYYLLSKSINENGFNEIALEQAGVDSIGKYQYENNIDEQKRFIDGNVEQHEMALMHFFPQKMKSTSRKSINFFQ